MNDKKHTPGPWKTQPHISLDRLEIRDADGRRIAECAMDFPMSAKTHDANARLIAAAPDMLDELMNYCAECNGDGAERCPFYNKDGDMCRVASNGTCNTWMTICKATGHDPATPWEVKK